MGKMSRAEHNVADFLSEENIKWEFEKPVSIKDDGQRTRTWYPDFYLKDIGLYVEVCGAQRNDYPRRKEIYKKNDIPIIFLETYKGEEKWQYFLKKSIIEFTEKQQKKWTELNLINNNLEKKKAGTEELQDISKKWSQIIHEIDKL